MGMIALSRAQKSMPGVYAVCVCYTNKGDSTLKGCFQHYAEFSENIGLHQSLVSYTAGSKQGETHFVPPQLTKQIGLSMTTCVDPGDPKNAEGVLCAPRTGNAGPQQGRDGEPMNLDRVERARAKQTSSAHTSLHVTCEMRG